MKILRTLACSSLVFAAASAVAANTIVLKSSAATNDSAREVCQEFFPTSLTCIPIVNNTFATALAVDLGGWGGIQEVDPGEVLVIDLDRQVIDSIWVVVKNNATNEQIYSGVANNFSGLQCSGKKCIPWD